MNELLYEKRFGPRSQIEVKLPFGRVESRSEEGSLHHTGLGDITLGVKQTLWHSLSQGAILSLGGEVVLPTGNDEKGLGHGTTVLEPYLAFGKILPADAFLHLQALLEHPLGKDKGDTEAQWRAALGFSTTSGQWGRTWSPILEILGARELAEGASTEWDLIPQVQVTLNTRQHIMANVGVRLPITDGDERPTRLMMYILWDWFDGGFFDGW